MPTQTAVRCVMRDRNESKYVPGGRREGICPRLRLVQKAVEGRSGNWLSCVKVGDQFRKKKKNREARDTTAVVPVVRIVPTCRYFARKSTPQTTNHKPTKCEKEEKKNKENNLHFFSTLFCEHQGDQGYNKNQSLMYCCISM